jgi:hypothetical protein
MSSRDTRRRSVSPNFQRRRLLAVVLLAAVIIVTVAVVAGALGGPNRSPRSSASVTTGLSSARGATTTSTRSTTSSTSTATPPPPPQAPYRVGLASLRVLEPTTPSLANAKTSSGLPARSLPTVIRYPASGNPGPPGKSPVPGGPPQRAAGPFPLVVFSQGYDYPAEGYSALLDAWARAGFVVVDPTYPETDPSTPGGPNESDIVNHPADLRFVISALIAASHRASSPLHGMVRADQIALIGQSDGGDVSLATSANTCCRDPRVKAAVILSGAELAAFGGTYFGSGSPPLLVVQGDADPINVPGCSAALYGQAPVPKYYLELLGASHLPPYVTPGRTRDLVGQAVISFLRYYLERKTSALAKLHRVADLPGVATLISTPSLAGRTTFCPGAP